MHGKALLFQDYAVARKIMLVNSPRKMKSLGRQVRGFDSKLWDANREDIVYQNSLAKFTQNTHLREALMETGCTTLVEASPYDKIWGIGLHESEARDISPDEWPGQNLLGEILTRVRNEIRSGKHDTLICKGKGLETD